MVDGRRAESSPWRLAVHGAMLHGLPAREVVELIKTSSYDGVYCEIPLDVHELPDLNGIDVTCVGFAPDDENAIAPGRAAEVAEALHASSAGCGRSCTSAGEP